MDADFALALSLQLEGNREIEEKKKRNINDYSGDDVILVEKGLATNPRIKRSRSNQFVGNSFNSQPMSIVDEAWELIDPVPNIFDLFLQFNEAFFDGLLAGVEVKWSARMTLCAGLCRYEGRGGLCSISLSQPLLKLRPRKDLVQTLLHEMIHAVLFVTHNNKDHDAHGPEFLKHMHRINKQTGSNITVYHNFHDEVNNYRQHWWRCDGPCQKRPPYFGIVRRSMNRAPSKNDTWWADHMRTCGGKYTKIKEPEDYGKKKSKRKLDEAVDSEQAQETGNTKKSVAFPGKGKALGGSDSEKISKWFKPRLVSYDKSQKENSLPGKSSSEESDLHKRTEDASKLRSSSDDTSQPAVNEKPNFEAGRAAWIEKLMKNQEDAVQKRKMFSGNSSKENRNIPTMKGPGKIRHPSSRASSALHCSSSSSLSTSSSSSFTSSSSLSSRPSSSFLSNASSSSSCTSSVSPSSSSSSSASSRTSSFPPNVRFPSSSTSSLSSSSSSSSSSISSSASFLTSSSFPYPSSLPCFSTSISSSSSSSSSSTSSSCITSYFRPPSSFPSTSSSSLSHSASPNKTNTTSPASNAFKIISRTVSETQPNDALIAINEDELATKEHLETQAPSINLDDSVTCISDSEELVSCPACPKKLPIHAINNHLDECLLRGS